MSIARKAPQAKWCGDACRKRKGRDVPPAAPNVVSIAPFDVDVDCPAELPEAARPIWARLVPPLRRQHTVLDEGLLVDYVLATWSRDIAAGALATAQKSGKDVARALSALTRASTHLAKLRAELEVSPKEARAARAPADETLGEELDRELSD